MNQFNNKGSTMVMLVIIISLLTILGMVIISLSVSQYKGNQLDSKKKKVFYIAEGALQGTYCKIYELVENAKSEATKKADQLSQSPYIDDKGRFNKGAYENAQKETFEIAFINYMDQNYQSYIKASQELPKKEDLQIKIEKYKKDPFKIHIRVKSTYKEKIEKIISVTYEITIPNYKNHISIKDLIGVTNWKIEK